MKQEKIDMIHTYINNNISPIIIEGATTDNFPHSVILSANCRIDLLNGHYEGIEFVPPEWYNDLMIKKDKKFNILVIDNITSISKDEQLKFLEILKYRKISTFELPENCSIIITCDKVNKEKISPEIYSLAAHI